MACIVRRALTLATDGYISFPDFENFRQGHVDYDQRQKQNPVDT